MMKYRVSSIHLIVPRVQVVNTLESEKFSYFNELTNMYLAIILLFTNFVNIATSNPSHYLSSLRVSAMKWSDEAVHRQNGPWIATPAGSQ